MKKQLKRIVSLIMVLSLFFTLGVVALAEEDFTLHGAVKVDPVPDAEGKATLTVALKGEGVNAGNCAFIAVKQSTGMMIWTQTELTDAQKAQIAAAVSDVDGSNYEIKGFCFGEGTFVMGEVIKDAGNQYASEYTFKVVGDVVILTCAAGKISHAVYGTYTIPEPDPPYEWKKVSVGSDTATGYGADNRKAFSKGNNWFVGQMVELADGEALTLDVQAGNPKNGTNFVGTVTLARSGDQVTVSYQVNEDILSALPAIDGYELGDQVTVTELLGGSYKVASSYTPVANNGAKYMTAFANGDAIAVPSGDTFYIYLHFEAVYTTYEVVLQEIAE